MTKTQFKQIKCGIWLIVCLVIHPIIINGLAIFLVPFEIYLFFKLLQNV